MRPAVTYKVFAYRSPGSWSGTRAVCFRFADMVRLNHIPPRYFPCENWYNYLPMWLTNCISPGLAVSLVLRVVYEIVSSMQVTAPSITTFPYRALVDTKRKYHIEASPVTEVSERSLGNVRLARHDFLTKHQRPRCIVSVIRR